LSTVSFFEPVAEGLSQVEERLREAPALQHEALTEAIEHLLSSGGKRVRPALALLAGGAMGADPTVTVSLAAAVEMLHTATLVHDDLIDGSLLRRGMPTLNVQWSPAATVLTGDYIFARAADLAASTGSVRVMSVFARTLMTMVNGEVNQLFVSRGKPSREDYERRIYAKTASMFELATEAAAVLAGAGEARIAAMAAYGREVGTAFQIVDDILDFVGDPNRVGKPVGGDLRQGLITLPALYFMESHPQDADVRALLDGRFGDPALAERLVAAIRASGAVNAALIEARDHVERGCRALADLPASQPRHALNELAEYIVRRDL
jgi:geranylgeranyl pyrophosphate synthase